MRIGYNRFEVVLVGKESVRSSGKTAAQIRRHGFNNVFLPQEAMAAPSAKVRHGQIGDTAQPLDLVPQLGLRLGVQDVEAELAQPFQIGSGPQLVDDGERIELPHGCVGPQTVERQMKAAVLHRELVVRQSEKAE